MKKITILLCVTMLLFCVPNTVVAKDIDSSLDSLSILTKHGYTEEAARAIPSSKRNEIAQLLLHKPETVDIAKLSMEVDILSEIEALFTYSDETLLQMGAELNTVVAARKELLEYYEMGDDKLAKVLSISKVEASLIKKAIAMGLNNKAHDHHAQKAGVTASGSITSSEMYYFQTVINRSSSSAPCYDVTLSYSWVKPYALGAFKDVIVVAWGGQLNSRNIDSSAEYHNYTYPGGSWAEFYTEREMDVTQTIQAGIEFEFDQALNGYKTESGFATFTIYQTRKQNLDSKIISHFCHKVLSIGGASISISASGPSVSIAIGTAYDKTPQKETIITY